MIILCITKVLDAPRSIVTVAPLFLIVALNLFGGLMSSSTPLQQSFSTYLPAIPEENKVPVYRLVSRFCAKLISGKVVDRMIRQFARDVRTQVRAWRHWATSSYYWGRLWRALVGSDVDGVHHEDMTFVQNHLSPTDRARLRLMYYTESTKTLTREETDNLQKYLRGHCWGVFNKRLRFVARYDQGISPEDLVSELMTHGVRTMRRYEHLPYLQVWNYTRAAVENHAINLIKRHTASGRAHLLPGDGKEREFDCRVRSYEEQTSALGKAAAKEALNAVVRRELGTNYADYVEALLGQRPDFDRWVETSKKYKCLDIVPSSRLHQAACQWAGISPSEIERDLAPLLMARV